MSELTFDSLREANVLRLPQFKNAKGALAHSKPDGSDWSPNDWLTAICGELGELANVLKKLRRGDKSADELRQAISDEIADVQIYLDLLAYQFRIDLGQATVDKFNEVSERVGAKIVFNADGAYVYELR